MEFHHLVDFPKDNTVFGTARENGSGKLRIFIVFDRGEGNVYSRNCREDSWEEVKGEDAILIRARIRYCRNFIPIYKITGHMDL